MIHVNFNLFSSLVLFTTSSFFREQARPPGALNTKPHCVQCIKPGSIAGNEFQHQRSCIKIAYAVKSSIPFLVKSIVMFDEFRGVVHKSKSECISQATLCHSGCLTGIMDEKGRKIR